MAQQVDVSEGEWAAYSSQPVWHFFVEPKSRTLCGKAFWPGVDYEKAPTDMEGQKVCKACARKLAAIRAKLGDQNKEG